MVRGQDGKLYGFNTDVAGVVVPLEQRLTLQGAKILVVGAGGVARAAAFGLKNKGAEVFITNRTAEKGQALARQAKAKYLKRADVAKIELRRHHQRHACGHGDQSASLRWKTRN